MDTTARVIGTSVSIAIGVGTLLGAAVVLLSDTSPLTIRAFSLRFVTQVLAIGFFGSIFVSVPVGVAGGLVARLVLRDGSRKLTSGQWIGRGGSWGVLLGGLGATSYSFLLNGWTGKNALVLVLFLAIGSLGGLVCGMVMGFWCAWTEKRAGSGITTD